MYITTILSKFCLIRYVSISSKSVKSGIFREVGDLGKTDRLIYKDLKEFRTSIDTLVRAGDHVLSDVHLNVRNAMAYDFSQTGSAQLLYVGD